MPHRRAAAAAITLSVALGSTEAHAYVLKHATDGTPVRWNRDEVAFVLHDSLSAVSGASAAASAAASAWSGHAGAPRASCAPGEAPVLPSVDGKNVVLRSAAFAPVGSALAVTVLSFEEQSGEVVDADIVLNPRHDLELLPRKVAAQPVAASNGHGSGKATTEGDEEDAGEDDAERVASAPKDAHALADDHARYDVGWVLAHEMGHAFGLGDDPSSPDALMYPYVTPDVAGPNAPTSSDLAGIDALYESRPDAPSPSAAAAGCATVAAPRSFGKTARYGGAVVAGALALVLARRRRREAGAAGIAALVALAPTVDASGAARHRPALVAAHVLEARAAPSEAGVLRTDLRVAVASPERGLDAVAVLPVASRSIVRMAVYGGSYAGIRQEVGRGVVPHPGEDVTVALRGARAGGAAGRVVVRHESALR